MVTTIRNGCSKFIPLGLSHAPGVAEDLLAIAILVALGILPQSKTLFRFHARESKAPREGS
jgi:hypothetical protein